MLPKWIVTCPTHLCHWFSNLVGCGLRPGGAWVGPTRLPCCYLAPNWSHMATTRVQVVTYFQKLLLNCTGPRMALGTTECLWKWLLHHFQFYDCNFWLCIEACYGYLRLIMDLMSLRPADLGYAMTVCAPNRGPDPSALSVQVVISLAHTQGGPIIIIKAPEPWGLLL